MDLFRSRKRDADQMGQGEGRNFQKRHAGLFGSLDDLLDIGKTEDPYGTGSEQSTTESEEDYDVNVVNKASRKQKVFAMKSVKRDKKKEKDLRKKIEKNMITMDDFLGKQSEFKMWLYEEKSKNAGDMSSPKLKTYFKQFVRLWNKRKLAGKYYRCSTLPESPAPLTPQNVNFLMEEPVFIKSPLQAVVEDVIEKSQPTSPFVTFGKTPPKVFRNKKFNLFGGAKDVALISVAPIGSPKVQVQNKENIREEEHYLVPRGGKLAIDATKDQTAIPRGATPYKVSTFPWASSDHIDIDTKDSSVDICSMATPPNLTRTSGDNCPSPPTLQEIRGANSVTTSDSPHVPPPPPPRVESLQRKNSSTKLPKLSSNYADPYDKLPCDTMPEDPDYQDPIDFVSTVNSRTKPDNARFVLKAMDSNNDEPDLSLYSKPVKEKRLSQEELEEMYAKPMKKTKRLSETNDRKATGIAGNLYEEIIDHIKSKEVTRDVDAKGHIQPKEEMEPKETKRSVEPDYQTIEECRANFKHDIVNSDVNYIKGDNLYKKNASPKFASLSRSSNKRVMAASSEKIYETYLSFGRKSKIHRAKNETKSAELGSELHPIKQRCKSQPDMSISEKMNAFEIDITSDDDVMSSQSSPKGFSSFKPKDMSSTTSVNQATRLLRDRVKSFDDLDAPGTPIILSTPSFDSLCNVTPLKNDSVSMKSFCGRSSSSENMSHCNMSTSTSSSLSFGPDDRSEKSTSLQSLHSSKSLSPVKEVEELPKRDTTPEKVDNINESGCSLDHDPCKSGFFPLTPGKLNALKHGIDFSNYLLKPKWSKESRETSESDTRRKLDSSNECSPESTVSSETDYKKRLAEIQTKLVIKDTLSGVKTNVDNSKSGVGSRRETERRHTVQTVQELQSNVESKKPNVPNIGVAGRSRKKEMQSIGVKSRTLSTDGRNESQSKRHRGDRVKDDCNYLETDLDKVASERPKVLMKKSKSHSGFETGTTVVTDIW